MDGSVARAFTGAVSAGEQSAQQQPKVASRQSRPEESGSRKPAQSSDMEQELRFEEGAEDLAGSATAPEPDAEESE